MNNDINFRNPNVVGELDYWGRWYYEQIGYGGVRLDAIKHITPAFLKTGCINFVKPQKRIYLL
jgi:alpha-amylase